MAEKANRFDLEAASSEYARLAQMKRDLEARRIEIDMRELPAISRQLREGGRTVGERQAIKRHEPQGPLAGVLRELRPQDETGEPSADIWAKYHALQAELEEIRLGVVEVESRLRKARIEASRAVCEAARTEHDEILAEIAATAMPFAHAMARYTRLHDELRQAGVATAPFLPPIQTYDIGRVLDWRSPLAAIVRQLVARGLVSPKGLPDAWTRQQHAPGPRTRKAA